MANVWDHSLTWYCIAWQGIVSYIWHCIAWYRVVLRCMVLWVRNCNVLCGYSIAWYCSVWLGDRNFGLDFGICGRWSPPVLWNALFISSHHSIEHRIYCTISYRSNYTIPYRTRHHYRKTQYNATPHYTIPSRLKLWSLLENHTKPIELNCSEILKTLLSAQELCSKQPRC